MVFVNKTATDAPWTAIQIFITAPHSKVGTCVMKFQLQVAGCVREIEAHHAAASVTDLCNPFHLKRLTGRVVDASQQDERDFVSGLFNNCVDVVVAQTGLTTSRRQLDQRSCRIKAVKAYL